MWTLYGVVAAKVEAHGTVGGACGARWAGSLGKRHGEAWNSPHLNGAGAGVVLGRVTVLITGALAIIAGLFHTQKPGTPVQQNHSNLRTKRESLTYNITQSCKLGLLY